MAIDKNFHLYLLIGQSNMAGRGQVKDEDKTPHPRVFSLNKAREWIPAVDPLHFDKPIAGVGPGLNFGKVMADHNPHISVGPIPCAAGGSPMSVWKIGAHWHQTDSHPYDDAIERTKLAMHRGVLKGILWHQGESDAKEENAGTYEDNLADLISRLRTDLNSPEVSFVAGTLADYMVERNPYARIVNEAIMRIPQRVKNTAYVESQGLTHKGDDLHFNTESARELGRRYAEAMLRLQK